MVYANNPVMQEYAAAVLRSTPNSENLVVRPLAEYPPLTDAPLTAAEIDAARVVLVPLVLADARRQNERLVVDDELIQKVRLVFNEERCRHFIKCAHETRDQLGLARPPPASPPPANAPPVNGAAGKRDLEDAENLHGREKRAKTEEVERDAKMEVDEEGPALPPADAPKLEAPPPPESAPSPAKQHYDVFTPPAPSSVVSETRNPSPARTVPPVPLPEVEGAQSRPIVIPDDDEDDAEDMDVDMDISSDDRSPPASPVLSPVSPTTVPPPASPTPVPLSALSAPTRSATPTQPAAAPPSPEATVPQRLAPATETELDVEVPASHAPSPAHTGEALYRSPPLENEALPPESATPTIESALTPDVKEPDPAPDATVTQDASTMAVSPPPQPHESPRSLEPEPEATTTAPNAEELVSEPANPYATTPGLWGIDVGSRMSVTLNFTFNVSEATHASIRRWSTRWDAPSRRAAEELISVRLLCLSLPQVQELDAQVSSGALSSAPADVATAIAALPVGWPDPGALVVLNGEQPFFADAFKSAVPLDVSATIRPGVNTLRVMLIGAQPDKVYALYAAPPEPEELRRYEDWRAKREPFATTVGKRRGEFTLGRTGTAIAVA